MALKMCLGMKRTGVCIFSNCHTATIFLLRAVDLPVCSCDPFNLHVKAGKGTPSISKHVSSKVWPTGRNRNVLAGCICSTGRTVKGGEGEGQR